METYEDTLDNGPETATKMFSAKDIPEIVRIFEEADVDGSGALDMEEFCEAMQKLYYTVSTEELIVLHMKIDTNCDGTVDIEELLDFLLQKNKASEKMDYKNQIFPKPFKRIPVDGYKPIVSMLFIPFNNDEDVSMSQTRPYKKGLYLSVNKDGIVKKWNDKFDISAELKIGSSRNKIPFSHTKRVRVNDMIYLREVEQLAISTSDRELFFYSFHEPFQTCNIAHALIVEDTVTVMHYWSNGIEAIFAFGDIKGMLHIFITYDVKLCGTMFCPQAKEKVSLRAYPTFYISNLLQKSSGNFQCLKGHIFYDMCSRIQYFPSLESFAICGSSSKTMALVASPRPCISKLSKEFFKSTLDEEFFTCVDYSPIVGFLVTGGADGLLRVWFPHKTTSCQQVLEGHVKPVTHIVYNPKDCVFVSLSEDKNVRVWSENSWLCVQSIEVKDMGRSLISSVCYNIDNNELFLTNSDIAKCIGRGTEVFKNMLTSHENPVCGAVYHSIYKQVISVCRNGVVTVWDILTGKPVMEFRIMPYEYVGHTAMSFDGAQRRLVTVSEDGKVRLWNSNNGLDLGVLPVSIQKKVTGIVCIDDRVFVSGRNSKIIYNLDIEGHKNRILKHDYLNGVSSMDVHGSTLVTASSNGNIIIWNTNKAEALYWLNTSQSPRIYRISETDQDHRETLHVKKEKKSEVQGTERGSEHKKSTALTQDKTHVNSNPLVICLKTREASVDTAALLTSRQGYIYAWPLTSEGGLLGKFKAVNDDDAVITTMSTDVNDQILLIGDSTGRIYLWDIQGFGLRRQEDKGPFEDIDGWCVSLCPPPLLGSWQASQTRVVSVRCDPASNNIITTGLDCNVQLWTHTGRLIGIFGRDEWDDPQNSPEENAEQEQERQPLIDSQPLIDLRFIPDRAQLTTGRTHATKNSSHMQQSVGVVKQGSKHTSKHIHLPPISATGHLTHSQGQFKPHPHQTPHIKGGTDLKQSSPQTASLHLNKTMSKIRRRLKMQQRDTLQDNILIPCPANTLLDKQGSEKTPIHTHLPSTHDRAQITTGGTRATKNSSHMQQSIGAVKQGSKHTSKHIHLPPISAKGPLTHSQGQFEPHPHQTPHIKGGTDLKQSSPQTASLHLNKTMSKIGRRLKMQQTDTLEDNILIPCPENTLLDKQGSEKTPIHMHLPSIPARAQLTTGRTNATKNSTHMQQSVGAVKQGSEHTSKHIHLPPISATGQLTHSQGQFKPHPRQTPHIKSGTDLKRSSPQTESLHLNKMMSRVGRWLKMQQRDTSEDNILKPCPANTLPDKQGSEKTPTHTLLPSIPDRAQLTTGRTNATKNSSLMQQSAHAVKQGSKHTSKHIHLPPISATVQLTQKRWH